jgi:CRP/FNR family cyclic AMP-dependent transcriptional regulator
MQQSISTTLSLSEMFDNLTHTQLELVASICEQVSYKKGDVLFEENDASDELYVVSNGGIEILINPSFVGLEEGLDSIVLTEMRRGQVLGEVALVDQGLRTATARVNEDNTHVLRIPRKRLMLLCDTYPELGYKLMKNLAADLALKMRNTDLIVRQYQLKLNQQ